MLYFIGIMSALFPWRLLRGIGIGVKQHSCQQHVSFNLSSVSFTSRSLVSRRGGNGNGNGNGGSPAGGSLGPIDLVSSAVGATPPPFSAYNHYWSSLHKTSRPSIIHTWWSGRFSAAASPLLSFEELKVHLSELDGKKNTPERRAELCDRIHSPDGPSCTRIIQKVLGDTNDDFSQQDTTYFRLHHIDDDDLSHPLAQIVVEPREGRLYGAAPHPALPIDVVAVLEKHALEKLREAGVQRIKIDVALFGLCKWILDKKRWKDANLVAKYGEEAAEAVEAVVLGRPRPGHSVLGVGTFRAAQAMWEDLANQYGHPANPGLVQDHIALFSGGRVVETLPFVDLREEAMRDFGGTLLRIHY